MSPSAPAVTVVLQSPRIRRNVGIDDGAFSLATLSRVAVLHSDHALESLRVDVSEDVPVIDLTSAWLTATRVVTDLDVGHLVPGRIHVRNQVSFGDLLMIDVEQDLHRGTVDGATDLVCLWNARQELAGVIAQGIEWLDDDDEAVRFENRGRALERIDDVGRLEVHVEAPVHVTGDDGHPFRVHALRDLNRFTNLLQEFVADRSVAGGEMGFVPGDGVGNEDAHAHLQSFERLSDELLVRDRSTLEAIVLERGETFCLHELELGHQAPLTGMLSKHAEVRGIGQLEGACRSLRSA